MDERRDFTCFGGKDNRYRNEAAFGEDNVWFQLFEQFFCFKVAFYDAEWIGKVANWLMGETLRLLKENGQEPEDLQFSPKHLASLIELAEAGSVNNQVAKEVFEQIFAEDVDPEAYVEEHGLKTVNDTGLLEAVSYTHLRAHETL